MGRSCSRCRSGAGGCGRTAAAEPDGDANEMCPTRAAARPRHRPSGESGANSISWIMVGADGLGSQRGCAGFQLDRAGAVHAVLRGRDGRRPPGAAGAGDHHGSRRRPPFRPRRRVGAPHWPPFSVSPNMLGATSAAPFPIDHDAAGTPQHYKEGHDDGECYADAFPGPVPSLVARFYAQDWQQTMLWLLSQAPGLRPGASCRHRADARERIGHHIDQRAIAHSVDGRGVDDVDQARRRLLLCEDQGLAAAHDMLGPPTARAGLTARPSRRPASRAASGSQRDVNWWSAWRPSPAAASSFAQADFIEFLALRKRKLPAFGPSRLRLDR
jgi:hypothetical protein